MSPATLLTRRRYKVAFAISFAFFVAYFDRTNVSVLIANRTFTDDLGITGNTWEQGLLVTGFLFPYGLCNFVTGPLGDWVGGRRGVIWAISAWTVLMVAMGFTSSFAVMLGLRIVLGLAESIMTPASNLIVSEWFPDRERARANSAWLCGLFVAPAISFPIIVGIVNVLDWRASFFVLAGVGAVIGLPMIWRWTADKPEDLPSVSEAELRHIRDGQSQPVAPEPVRSALRKLFADRRLWICSFSYMGYGLGFWGLSTFVPSYLEHERHLNFTTSGTFAVLPWLAAAALTLVGGFLGDRRPSIRVLLWSGGYLLSAVLSYLGVVTGLVSLSIALLSAAIGLLGFTLGPMWAVVQEITPRGTTALGTGVVNGFSYIASAFGPALVGLLVDSTGSYNAGFFLLAGFLVVTAAALAPMWRSGFGSRAPAAAPAPEK